MFNAGFNMKKKIFFKNLGNICISGILVTLICFAIYASCSLLTTLVFNFEYTDYYDDPNITGKIDLNIMQMLLFTAILCSSDAVAAVSIITYEEQPKL